MSLERQFQRATRKRRAREERRLVRETPAGTVPLWAMTVKPPTVTP
jgi:hypothetical protein